MVGVIKGGTGMKGRQRQSRIHHSSQKKATQRQAERDRSRQMDMQRQRDHQVKIMKERKKSQVKGRYNRLLHKLTGKRITVENVWQTYILGDVHGNSSYTQRG